MARLGLARLLRPIDVRLPAFDRVQKLVDGQLGEYGAGEDERAADVGSGGHDFAKQECAADCGEERFERHDHGGSGRGHKLLAYDLKRIGYASGADASVNDGDPALGCAGPVDGSFDDGPDPAEDRGGADLSERKQDGVHVSSKGVYDEDVPREEDCGEQQHHVRQGDGTESVGDAQQIEADNGDGDADDDAEMHSSTQYDEGQQWRHDDV